MAEKVIKSDISVDGAIKKLGGTSSQFLKADGSVDSNSYMLISSLLTAGDAGVGAIKYNGTTNTAGQFYGGTTTPTGTTRLNYSGYFYPTFINLAGSSDTATAATHYFVETGTDGYVRPKLLADVKTEIVTKAAVEASLTGAITSHTHAYIPTTHTINSIVNGTGFLKNNGSGTWSWDNSTYSLSSHAHAESTITFTDITTGNATTSLHGYLPKLGGGTTNYLRADGTWNNPVSGVVLTTTDQNIAGYKTFTSGSVTSTSSDNSYFIARSTGVTMPYNGFVVNDDANTYQTQYGYDNQNSAAYIWSQDALSIAVGNQTNAPIEALMGKFTSEALHLKDIATTAATPSTGFGAFYVNGDWPYFKSDAGTVTSLGLSDTSVTYAKVANDLKSKQTISALDIDWSTGGIFTKTMTTGSTFTFSNLQLNKTITLVISGNYTFALPIYCKKISGTYDGATTNYIQAHCTNSTTAAEEVWYTISKQA